MRPVINLKPLNQYIQNIHFRMKNIQMGLILISLGDFMVSLNLKDAYFNIPIFSLHRKYVRFIWTSQRYEFTCLPFGYSLAPRVFTKVFKPIISHLRLPGLRIIIFLDDILLVASSKQKCLDQLQFLRQLITDLGFIVNDKKSQLEPSTKLTFLGFIIDSLDMKLYLPQDKIHKTVSACSSLISTASPTIGQVAQVTGLLVSAFPAVPYLRLYYRSIESCKSRCLSEHNGDYDHHISLSSDALADLNWVIHTNAKHQCQTPMPNTNAFQQITQLTLVPNIDLFASSLNAKLSRFVSWHPEPRAEVVNAFSINWSNLKCYVFPPFSLLPRVFRQISVDKALVLLIAPVWKTQSWYPLLLQLLVE